MSITKPKRRINGAPFELSLTGICGFDPIVILYHLGKRPDGNRPERHIFTGTS
jgi:hypothetical protein